jgi:hypothetical protein
MLLGRPNADFRVLGKSLEEKGNTLSTQDPILNPEAASEGRWRRSDEGDNPKL